MTYTIDIPIDVVFFLFFIGGFIAGFAALYMIMDYARMGIRRLPQTLSKPPKPLRPKR